MDRKLVWHTQGLGCDPPRLANACNQRTVEVEQEDLTFKAILGKLEANVGCTRPCLKKIITAKINAYSCIFMEKFIAVPCCG